MSPDPPTLVDYDGPLGALEPELKRRRIAVATDTAGRICFVRPDSVILEFGDGQYGAVDEALSDREMEVLGVPPATPPPSGVVGARRHPSTRVEPEHRWRTDRLCELMHDLHADEYRVRPNHVYLADGVARHLGLVGASSSGTPGLGTPSSVESTVRPALAPAWMRPRLALPHRDRPNVLVLDSGLRTRDAHAEHPALANCKVHKPWRTEGRWNDEDEPDDDDPDRRLDAQAGHGTFISGIITQLCPDAVVHHRGVLTSYGDGDDASITYGIDAALGQVDRLDIVVMTFGTYCPDDLEPSAVAAIGRLPSHTLIVASAGNDATSRQYFPAALPHIVGVGALDHGARAAFSNFGSWVDACAPGVDVRSTFFTDFDELDDEDRVVNEFRGWAMWSGTSFSAPKVAAVVAQEMYVNGGTAKDAWARLSSPSAFRVPDLGVVFNV